MPNHRNHGKGKNAREDIKNNNCGNGNQCVRTFNDRRPVPTGMTKCCLPTGCDESFISISEPGDAVRVICNNDNCNLGNWMHASCFDIWETSVLNYLRSCGRARSWSEKQRLQNLWTKKGYDLAYKACDCKCGRGHLRKDLDHMIRVPTETKTKKKNKKKNDKPTAVMSNHGHFNANHIQNANDHVADTPMVKSQIDNRDGVISIDNNANNTANVNVTQNHNINMNDYVAKSLHTNINVNCISNVNTQPITNGQFGSSPPMILQRLRAGSFSSSAGSSPPTSHGSESPAPMSPAINGLQKVNGFDFFPDAQQSTPFKHRIDMSAFCGLPRHKLNSYHIKMEDEEPSGNDETRCFVLTNLSSYKVTSIECVLCKIELPVFASYPLIDGTFFLSPQPYSDGVVQLLTENRIQYLNAVCMNCLEGWTDIRCYACKSKWDGHALQIGTMYSYDIFAAMPCCQKRLTCKACHRAVVDIKRGLPFFSEYSCNIECPYCKVKDTHFIRPLSETFNVKLTNSIWKP